VVVVAGAHRFLLAALEQLLPHRHDDEQRHAANEEASSHSASGTRTTTE